MSEVSDEYRQDVIDKLMANEQKGSTKITGSSDTPNPRTQEVVAEETDDPLAQVLQNKSALEGEEDADKEALVEKVTKVIRTDIIGDLIKG